MAETGRVEDLVSRFLAARSGAEQVPAEWESAAPLSESDAYAVQAGVARACGPVAAFKVANKAGQPRIMAPIFASDVCDSPSKLVCSAGEDIGIELELGFRVRAPLPAKDDPQRDAKLAECLSLVAVIEIVRTRISGTPSPLMKLADNQINGGLVVGSAIDAWQHMELSQVKARLSFGDEVVLDGPATIPGGNALENFKALEEIVEDHCGGLHPGQVVITGSLNGLPYRRAPLAVRGDIEGIGSVSLDVVRTR